MTARGTSSLLKPLGEHFETRAKMCLLEAAVPSVESPALGCGSLQGKQFISGTAQATNRPAGGEGQVWVGLALSFLQCQLQLEPLESIKIQRYMREMSL